MMFPDASDWVVLIVDDDEDNLGVPMQVLEFIGAAVHTAEDGQEALNILAEVEPTFVLADLSMPVMDGWELLKTIRADSQLSGLVVIALTAHAMPEDRQKVLDAGFDGYISKPFILTTFMDEIMRCLDSLQATG